jgi:hypothetical protein
MQDTIEVLAAHQNVVAVRFSGNTNSHTTTPFDKKGLLSWDAKRVAVCNLARCPFVFDNVPAESRYFDWEARTLTGTTRAGGVLNVPSQFDAPWCTRIQMCVSTSQQIIEEDAGTFVLCVVDVADAGELYDGEVDLNFLPEKACIVFWRDDSLRYLKSESGVFKRVKKDDFTFPCEIFKSLPPRPSQMLVSPPMNDVGEFSGFLQALLGSHIHPRGGAGRRYHEKTLRLPPNMIFTTDFLPWYHANEYTTVVSCGQLSRTFKITVQEGEDGTKWGVTFLLVKTHEDAACAQVRVSDECDHATAKTFAFLVDVIKDKFQNQNLLMDMMKHDHSVCIKHHADMKQLLKRVADEGRNKWNAVSWAFDSATKATPSPCPLGFPCGKALPPMRQASEF